MREEAEGGTDIGVHHLTQSLDEESSGWVRVLMWTVDEHDFDRAIGLDVFGNRDLHRHAHRFGVIRSMAMG
jgi:hypothetical protein